MEVKINKEIRNYTESMFFGLSLRQFIFSVLACGVAAGLFFLLRPHFGTETLSWVCILGASPFAMMGFVKYNGMTAEQFVWAWIKSEFLMPKKLMFLPDNLYYEALKPNIEAREKGLPVAQKKQKRQAAKPEKKSKKRKEAAMIKTLRNLFRQDKEKFVVPKSVQAVIPIKTIWEDGIFLVGKNKYAKTFKFEDINYAVASREDKEAMFLEYSELLNALDSGATTKITINNRRLNKADFEQTILIPMAEDGLDKYRKEYNKMLLDKATGANSIVQDKYVTVSVCKKNIEEARSYFARVGADLIGHFSRIGSKCTELDAGEKLRIFHDFYRTGEETAFSFDMVQSMRKGHDFKDYICPDTFELEKDCFKIGGRYGL